MADWAEEKAKDLWFFCSSWDANPPCSGPSPTEVLAQALREAEARGMERAAEMTWVSGDANECCQELFEQHQYNLRAEVKKCTGTERQGGPGC